MYKPYHTIPLVHTQLTYTPPHTRTEEVHIAMSAYSPQNEDEIAFEKGVLLEVFEKNLDGWWKVR